MSVYIAGSSALYFWRRCSYGQRLLKNIVSEPLVDCPVNHAQLQDVGLDNERFGPTPIHLMTPSHDLRISKTHYKYTVCKRSFPDTAFRQLSASICIASPELCLLQSMAVYSRFKFMELCMELCGKYALVKESPYGFITRDYQLTSLDAVRMLASKVKSARAFSEVQVLLEHMQEGSRSPMETRSYLFMCLPKRWGGYNLPKPMLNMRIQLSKEEQRLANRRYFECDMCWPEKQIIVEYDGHENHAERKDRNRDSVKRNILISKGYTVYTLTGGQTGSVHAFERVVREIARLLRYRLQGFPEDWDERRRELRNELFVSMCIL